MSRGSLVRLGGLLAASMSLGLAADARADQKQLCVDAHTAAQELRQAGKLVAAREQLVACAKATCPAVAREDCTKWLAEIDQALPTVVVEVRDAKGAAVQDARLTIDGADALPARDGVRTLDPGAHTFRVDAAGPSGIERVEVLRTGERNHVVTLTLPAPRDAPPPAAPPRPVPTLAYVLGGVGVVGVVGFSALALWGKHGQSELDACKPACQQSDVDAVKTKYLVANVAGAIGLVSLGAAAIVYATRKPEETEAALSWDAVVGSRGGGVTLRARF